MIPSSRDSAAQRAFSATIGRGAASLAVVGVAPAAEAGLFAEAVAASGAAFGRRILLMRALAHGGELHRFERPDGRAGFTLVGFRRPRHDEAQGSVRLAGTASRSGPARAEMSPSSSSGIMFSLISSPSLSTTMLRTTFCNWRTLPGQR